MMEGLKELRCAVLALYKEGKKQVEILKLLKHHKVNRMFIYRTIRRFTETGTTEDRPRSGRPRLQRTESIRQSVRHRLRRNPARSVRKLSKELNVPRTTLQRIVKRKVRVRPFKKYTVQFLTPDQKMRRKQRAEALLARFADEDVENFLRMRRSSPWSKL